MTVSELLIAMDFDGLVLVRCNGEPVCGGPVHHVIQYAGSYLVVSSYVNSSGRLVLRCVEKRKV